MRASDVLTGFRAYRRDKFIALNMDTPGLSWPAQSWPRSDSAGLLNCPPPEPPALRAPGRPASQRVMRHGVMMGDSMGGQGARKELIFRREVLRAMI